MITGVELAHQGGEHGGHARCRGAADLGPFEQRHALLEHGDGGVGKTRIDVTIDLPLEGTLGILGGLVDVARGQEQPLAGLEEL